MQLTKFSKPKIIHTPGKNLSVADMLCRSFTKAELQLNQVKHKQIPPQIDFVLLTILAMSVQNTQLAGFLLTGNRSNFLYVEGSTAWLYDCPHFLSPLYKADRCFDRLPIHFKDTLMYVDPFTRQTYDYATPISCDNNPRNIIELDPDSDDQDFYILGPEPIKRKPPLLFTPS